MSVLIGNYSTWISRRNTSQLICVYVFNPFFANAPFLYPLKTSENCKIFWCLQGVEKGWIGNEWANIWSEIWRWSLDFSSLKIHTEAQTTRLKTSQDFFVSWPWHLTRIVRWSRWKARFRFLLAFNSMLPFISRQTYPFYKTLYQDGVH